MTVAAVPTEKNESENESDMAGVILSGIHEACAKFLGGSTGMVTTAEGLKDQIKNYQSRL